MLLAVRARYRIISRPHFKTLIYGVFHKCFDKAADCFCGNFPNTILLHVSKICKRLVCKCDNPVMVSKSGVADLSAINLCSINSCDVQSLEEKSITNVRTCR